MSESTTVFQTVICDLKSPITIGRVASALGTALRSAHPPWRVELRHNYHTIGTIECPQAGSYRIDLSLEALAMARVAGRLINVFNIGRQE